MSDILKVKVTNQRSGLGISGVILTVFFWLMFMKSCTPACPQSENEVQCAGQLSKQLKIEFDKGYSK